jgi:hypothetical protein
MNKVSPLPDVLKPQSLHNAKYLSMLRVLPLACNFGFIVITTDCSCKCKSKSPLPKLTTHNATMCAHHYTRQQPPLVFKWIHCPSGDFNWSKNGRGWTQPTLLGLHANTWGNLFGRCASQIALLSKSCIIQMMKGHWQPPPHALHHAARHVHSYAPILFTIFCVPGSFESNLHCPVCESHQTHCGSLHCHNLLGKTMRIIFLALVLTTRE